MEEQEKNTKKQKTVTIITTIARNKRKPPKEKHKDRIKQTSMNCNHLTNTRQSGVVSCEHGVLLKTIKPIRTPPKTPNKKPSRDRECLFLLCPPTFLWIFFHRPPMVHEISTFSTWIFITALALVHTVELSTSTIGVPKARYTTVHSGYYSKQYQ